MDIVLLPELELTSTSVRDAIFVHLSSIGEDTRCGVILAVSNDLSQVRWQTQIAYWQEGPQLERLAPTGQRRGEGEQGGENRWF